LEKNPVKPSPSTASKITGFSLLAITLLIVLLIKCPTQMQYFIIYALVGIGMALVLAKSAGRARFSVKLWNWCVGLGGGVALPFILFFTNPVGKFKPDNCSSKQSVTVFVHGKKGKQDMILRQQGYVVMDIGAERKKATINENGEAYFQNLQVGDNVRLNIDFSEPYKSIYPDSVYNIDEEGRIYLPVALEGIEKVKGIVLYDDKPLEGVTVRIDMSESLSATTDVAGNFVIPIPDSLQNKKYTVWFIKTGFKAISKDAYPQTGIPLSVVMER
jgi:hypothetical protein